MRKTKLVDEELDECLLQLQRACQEMVQPDMCYPSHDRGVRVEVVDYEAWQEMKLRLKAVGDKALEIVRELNAEHAAAKAKEQVVAKPKRRRQA